MKIGNFYIKIVGFGQVEQPILKSIELKERQNKDDVLLEYSLSSEMVSINIISRQYYPEQGKVLLVKVNTKFEVKGIDSELIQSVDELLPKLIITAYNHTRVYIDLAQHINRLPSKILPCMSEEEIGDGNNSLFSMFSN